jgi:AraC-like DNA-binding protein
MRPAEPGVLGDVLPHVILELLQDADPEIRGPNIGSVAEVAGFSVRTLQRRLAREDLNFKKMIEQIRFQVAARLLVESDAKVIDIGYDLGYSDPSHFSRAFRRWSGIPPSAYRDRRRAA